MELSLVLPGTNKTKKKNKSDDKPWQIFFIAIYTLKEVTDLG